MKCFPGEQNAQKIVLHRVEGCTVDRKGDHHWIDAFSTPKLNLLALMIPYWLIDVSCMPSPRMLFEPLQV
jgi:hypothetical protein